MKSDFNGDGKADVLWQNSSGARAIWLMNGTNLQQQCLLRNRGDVLEHQKLLIVNAWRRSVASGMWNIPALIACQCSISIQPSSPGRQLPRPRKGHSVQHDSPSPSSKCCNAREAKRFGTDPYHRWRRTQWSHRPSSPRKCSSRAAVNRQRLPCTGHPECCAELSAPRSLFPIRTKAWALSLPSNTTKQSEDHQK